MRVRPPYSTGRAGSSSRFYKGQRGQVARDRTEAHTGDGGWVGGGWLLSLGSMATTSEEVGDLAPEITRQLRNVADAAENLCTSQGYSPLANGTLMAELEPESDYAAPDPWGGDPVMAARNLAGTALVAAIDYLRSFAAAVEAHQPFAPFITSRGVIEACSVAAYLGEQRIGAA